MFKVNNIEIGKYLDHLIKNSKYKNASKFCEAYLILRDGNANQDDIQNMRNRISQIKNGRKGIQIEDLPIFSELLEVSIEDILSAGTLSGQTSVRKSNYSIAFSNNQSEWEDFIQRPDKLILNPDEYNKTIIDYALEAGNYALLKYLMDKNYIWFVSNNKDEYWGGFSAGTNIKRREIPFLDPLEYRMKENNDLRYKMIILAINNKDFEMLDKLHARELPFLYTINPLRGCALLSETKLPDSDNIKQMIKSISDSENTILSYFLDEFEIASEFTPHMRTFIFPFASQVLESLICKNRFSESKIFLEHAIDFDKKIWKKLQKLIKKSNNDWNNFYFSQENGFVSYFMPLHLKNDTIDNSRLITNIIKADVTSNNPEVQFLITELNNIYDSFSTQYKKKERII